MTSSPPNIKQVAPLLRITQRIKQMISLLTASMKNHLFSPSAFKTRHKYSASFMTENKLKQVVKEMMTVTRA